MVLSTNSNDGLPGIPNGGVSSGPGMQKPTQPQVGMDGGSLASGLVHPRIQVDGAFAVGDTPSS